MPHPDLAVVTGAFSYTGRYVTRRLLGEGVRVRTLTRNPDTENPFGGRVEVAPLDFSDPDGLRRSMQGAGVFYNTYWIRYAHGRVTFDLAVENTGTLFEAARRAGVGRIVHFSVTNVSPDSGLPYFRGKAQVEDMLVGLGVPYSIIRPTLVFGVGDRCSTTWHGRCGAFLSSPSTGAATIRFNPSMSKTLRPRRWRPGLRARVPSPTLPARTHSPSVGKHEEALRLISQMSDIDSETKRRLQIEALKGMGQIEELVAFLKPPRSADEVIWIVSSLLDIRRFDEAETLLSSASELVDEAIRQELLNTITVRRMI